MSARYGDLWHQVLAAMEASEDRCARCKVCERQADAVFEAIQQAGYVIVPASAPVDRDSAGSTDSGDGQEAASPAGEK